MGKAEWRNKRLTKEATPNYYDSEAEKGWTELSWEKRKYICLSRTFQAMEWKTILLFC